MVGPCFFSLAESINSSWRKVGKFQNCAIVACGYVCLVVRNDFGDGS